MVFSSHIFVYYFLPIALLVYYLLPRRGKHLGLTILSYVFYGWANPNFIFLMFTSTVVDYFCGLIITGQLGGSKKESDAILQRNGKRTRKQKIALIASICTNLSLLGFFKYFNFTVENYNSLINLIGFSEYQWENVLRITLPLGISFYTFQSMSYTIDVYRGDARAIRNFIDFACYVSMFPQLVAGPIVRFSEVENQLRHRKHTLEKFARGISFFALGMAKKILIANPCGKIADTVFDAGTVATLDAWYSAFAYSFQIYFDFSGYSDMAIGLGLMLGFMFPKNFDSPYHSESITEFWGRWHLSLSSWLRDYLYIPLGGNRRGKRRTYFNLAIVMLLGGLWHGAAWNFVIWGGIHGLMLALERMRNKRSFFVILPKPFRVGATFLLVLLGWVFFRSNDLPKAISHLGSMFGLARTQPGANLVAGLIYKPYYLLTIIMAAVVVWTFPQTWDWTKKLNWWKTIICFFLFVVSLIVLATQAYNPFIYFIF